VANALEAAASSEPNKQSLQPTGDLRGPICLPIGKLISTGKSCERMAASDVARVPVIVHNKCDLAKPPSAERPSA